MELLEEVLRKDSIEQVRQTKEDLDKKHVQEMEKIKGQHAVEMEVRCAVGIEREEESRQG